MENVKSSEAQLTMELYNRWRGSQREDWASQVREDEQFRHNVQWTSSQRTALKNRGRSPVVLNQIDPAIEQAKALMTAKRPSFIGIPREDTDVKMAKMAEKLLEYAYDISDGQQMMANHIDDFLTKSMGVFICYYDPLAANGKGRVKFMDLDPLEVIISPDTRRRDMQDSDHILIPRKMTVKQGIFLYPDFEAQIIASPPTSDTVFPSTTREAGEGQVFPGDYEDVSSEYRLFIERYTMKKVKLNSVLEIFSGKEFVMTDKEIMQYLMKQFYVVGNKVFSMEDTQQVESLMAQMSIGEISDIQVLTGEQLVQVGQIQIYKRFMKRCFRYVSVYETLLFHHMLSIDEYPIKFSVNKWNRTPYPESDVRYAKGINEYINKTNSLIIAHASAATNIKLLIPEGSMDIKVARNEWAKPDAVMTFNPEYGTPFTPQMLPLPTELYHNVDRWKKDIQMQIGVPELIHGITDNAPDTFRGTMAMEEFAQRKISAKLRIIEETLGAVGRVLFKMMQQYYTNEETFRIIQPSGQISEVRLNYMGIDDFSHEIKRMNDISIGMYDFRIQGGSSLPSNRWAQFDYYMTMYREKLIDQIEVLKKTELVDVDGVLERMNYVKQLEQELMRVNDELKNVKGDLQTAERESTHDRKRLEVEKFKTKIGGLAAKAGSSQQLFDARLSDILTTERQKANQNVSRSDNKNPNRI